MGKLMQLLPLTQSRRVPGAPGADPRASPTLLSARTAAPSSGRRCMRKARCATRRPCRRRAPGATHAISACAHAVRRADVRGERGEDRVPGAGVGAGADRSPSGRSRCAGSPSGAEPDRRAVGVACRERRAVLDAARELVLPVRELAARERRSRRRRLALDVMPGGRRGAERRGEHHVEPVVVGLEAERPGRTRAPRCSTRSTPGQT